MNAQKNSKKMTFSR